jgi:hypothetical protein
MNNLLTYLWIILLGLYIISPFDAHPLFMDDLIAAGVLFYVLYKNARRKKDYEQYYSSYKQSQSSGSSQENGKAASQGPVTLDEAYRLLGVTRSTPWDEIQRAYKEKIIKSHPDKVNHLSTELQEKAREITLNLNEALDIIKRSQGR